jgi:predicted nucleotidyltransferase
VTGPSERALEVAREETEVLIEDGARAVILTGSHARGDANQHSDLDLRVIGDGPSKKLKRNGEFLVAISWLTLDEHNEVFEDPEKAGSAVPGWTSAIVLHDPEGLAAQLQRRAERWDFDDISKEADKWVGQEITELAEEIHTVLGNLLQNKPAAAAAERSQLAMGLAQLLSVHKRIPYESENDLWSLVAEAMGGDYADLQKRALAQDPIELKAGVDAVLEMFGRAAAETQSLLDQDQKEVVAHACDIAGHPLPD